MTSDARTKPRFSLANSSPITLRRSVRRITHAIADMVHKPTVVRQELAPVPGPEVGAIAGLGVRKSTDQTEFLFRCCCPGILPCVLDQLQVAAARCPLFRSVSLAGSV